MVGFSAFIKANRIQEWESFYLDYSRANDMLEQYIRKRAYYNMRIASSNPVLKKIESDKEQSDKEKEQSQHCSRHEEGWIGLIDREEENDAFIDWERSFFSFLDFELRKVCRFYKEQETQFVYNVNQLGHELFETNWQKNPSATSELQVRAKELYRGLDLVKKFCELNRIGFRKILKKHHKRSNLVSMKDKIMDAIEKSVIFNPPLIEEMGRKLEHMYATNFTHGDVKQSGKELRGQKEKNGGDWTSFKVGFSVGLSFVCIIIIIVCFSFTPDIENQPFFRLVFPLYRGLGLILILMWMWAGDVYVCEKLHINQNNILKVDHRSYLRSVDVLHVAGTLSLVYFLFAVAYFGFEAFPVVKKGLHLEWVQNEYLSFVMLILVLVSFVCPYPILYPNTRYYILKALKRILFAPVYEVKFIDFFLADQLCSLVRVLDDISYSICFFISGSFVRKDATCESFTKDYARYFVAFLPYYWRFVQCFRRYHNSKEKGHLMNAGKYLMSILVTLFSFLAPYGNFASGVWIAFAVIATVYSYAWDILKDWGLLERGPGFPLRKKLRLPDKRLYYVAAILNFFMRLAWVSTISPAFFPVRADFWVAALSFVEIVRRGMWNFFRLENEHLNNCGKFRALNILVVPHFEPPVLDKQESNKQKLEDLEVPNVIVEQAPRERRLSNHGEPTTQTATPTFGSSGGRFNNKDSESQILMERSEMKLLDLARFGRMTRDESVLHTSSASLSPPASSKYYEAPHTFSTTLSVASSSNVRFPRTEYVELGDLNASTSGGFMACTATSHCNSHGFVELVDDPDARKEEEQDEHSLHC